MWLMYWPYERLFDEVGHERGSKVDLNLTRKKLVLCDIRLQHDGNYTWRHKYKIYFNLTTALNFEFLFGLGGGDKGFGRDYDEGLGRDYGEGLGCNGDAAFGLDSNAGFYKEFLN